MNYSVVIPNYNGSRWLWSCLESIESNKKIYADKIETILVDNGSTDGSKELYKKWGKGKLVEFTKNQGFAAAVNAGAKEAAFDWLVVLNNDVVLDKNWFLQIDRIAKKDKGACFGGTVLNATGTRLESRGLAFDRCGKCWNLGNKEKFNWKKLLKLAEKKVWGISGAAMVIRKDVFEKIGGFDEDFFAYEEDADLCCRLDALGYHCFWVPGAVAFHAGGATSRQMGNFRSRMDNRNWIWLMVKNFSKKTWRANRGKIITERLRNLKYLFFDTFSSYGVMGIYYLPKSLIWLLVSTIKGIPKMIKKRQQFKLLLQSN